MVSTTAADAAKSFELMRAGNLPQALLFAERAVAGSPVCTPGHGFLAALLLQLGRADDAEQVVNEALALGSGVADSYDGLAYVSMALGQHDRANSLYRRATEIAPGVPRYWYNFASSERSLGRLVEAEAACDRAIAADPAAFPSYLLRSELRVQSPDANHIEALRTQLAARDSDHRARVFLGYALAKELDDLQHYDDAFHWFHVASQARRSRLNYDVAADTRKLARIAEVFPASLVRASNSGTRPAPGDGSQFIFILGLPRSGTTLVERILTGLDGVRSNGETENFSRALLGASQSTGDVFAQAAAAAPAAVASAYARFANPSGGGGRIVEKMPMNYLYAGAIHRALPGASLLLLRRSPLDSCFAMYRTLFGEAYPFSYDLKELARYYGAYERLVGHWREALGDQLHEIVYEDLVREPNAVGARIARHCGLRWDDIAVDIQRNQSVSLTASAAQVRRPIYGSSSGRWRYYRGHLQGLIANLRENGVSLPYDV